MSGALLAAGAVATTAIASGAADEPHATAQADVMSPGAQAAYAVHTAIRPPAVRPRPHRHAASRSHARRALTGTPRDVGRILAAQRGWRGSQFDCLDRLWTRESNWQATAQNASGAYGIPQALPASKMSMMGSDWRTNAVTQIRWGLYYIAAAYGSPCAALAHSYRYNYY